jgi:hypothetical protein
MNEMRKFLEQMDFHSKEAADYLNRHLGTRYPAHRIDMWMGVRGYVPVPIPQKVKQFIRGYLA